MNIQLRDSQRLQDAIYKRADKRPGTLPRAQLHPELLAGMVDCDRGGFEIRSEVQAGDERGQPVAMDVENMKLFLPEPDTCTAHWFVANVKQGDAVQRIPSELRFTFEKGGMLVIRTQSAADVNKLTAVLPTDRQMKCDAVIHEGKMTIMKAAGEKDAPIIGRSVAQLMVEAAKAGVPWDTGASVETMAERIAEAQEGPKPKADDAPKGKKVTKSEAVPV